MMSCVFIFCIGSLINRTRHFVSSYANITLWKNRKKCNCMMSMKIPLNALEFLTPPPFILTGESPCFFAADVSPTSSTSFAQHSSSWPRLHNLCWLLRYVSCVILLSNYDRIAPFWWVKLTRKRDHGTICPLSRMQNQPHVDPMTKLQSPCGISRARNKC